MNFHFLHLAQQGRLFCLIHSGIPITTIRLAKLDKFDVREEKAVIIFC